MQPIHFQSVLLFSPLRASVNVRIIDKLIFCLSRNDFLKNRDKEILPIPTNVYKIKYLVLFHTCRLHGLQRHLRVGQGQAEQRQLRGEVLHRVRQREEEVFTGRSLQIQRRPRIEKIPRL